jgi:hypothetical protein
MSYDRRTRTGIRSRTLGRYTLAKAREFILGSKIELTNDLRSRLKQCVAASEKASRRIDDHGVSNGVFQMIQRIEIAPQGLRYCGSGFAVFERQPASGMNWRYLFRVPLRRPCTGSSRFCHALQWSCTDSCSRSARDPADLRWCDRRCRTHLDRHCRSLCGRGGTWDSIGAPGSRSKRTTRLSAPDPTPIPGIRFISGLDLAALGGALAIDEWRCVVAVGPTVLAYWITAKREESCWRVNFGQSSKRTAGTPVS